MSSDPGDEFCIEGSAFEEAGDFDRAIELYERAVSLGHVSAMVNLGNIYDDWVKPPQPAKAVALYRRAATLGSASAACNLATHYKKRGNRIEQFKWLALAADLGDEDSRAMIGGTG